MEWIARCAINAQLCARTENHLHSVKAMGAATKSRVYRLEDNHGLRNF